MGQELLEWLGYVASTVVLISLLMSSIKKLRWINLFGALMFGTYGFMIGSLPTGFMNFGIVLIDVYFLLRMYLSKDFFRVMPINEDTEYLKYFLDFYEKDISNYTDLSKFKIKDAKVKLYLLRNMNPAGIFICSEHDKETLEITLDYVIPKFRDFKIGSFIFGKQKEFFSSQGYNTFIIFTKNKDHIKYITKMGFIEKQFDGRKGFTKVIK